MHPTGPVLLSPSIDLRARRCGAGVPPAPTQRGAPRCGAGVPPALLLALIAGLLVTPPPLLAADPGAALFVDLCTGCHTVGDGDREGPDLIAATKYPHDELDAAVRRMTEYAGPMSDAQIDSLVALLSDPGVKERIAAAQNPPAQTLPPGDPAVGRKLFFGEATLAAGGSPCFACHGAAGRGGTLARDLTGAIDRLGETVVLNATERPAFPMMKAAYANRAVTPDEARHVAAYLATTGSRLGEPEWIRPVHAAAGGLTLLTLGGVALLFRARRAGVRERLLRDAERSERA